MSFLPALLAGAVAGILANIVASSLERWLAENTQFGRLSTGWRLALTTIVFAAAFLAAFSLGQEECGVSVSGIFTEKSVIPTNDSMVASITVDNPAGLGILYNWQAVYGKMEPGARSSSSQSRYFPPSEPVDDTITAVIDVPGCPDIRRSKELSVVASQGIAAPGKEFEIVLLGQDGKDLAVSGCANGDLPLGPPGTIDNHIVVSGFNNFDQLERIDILDLDKNNHWQHPCTYPNWQLVKRKNNNNGLDLYFEPVHRSPVPATFTIILTFSDGTSLRSDVAGIAR